MPNTASHPSPSKVMIVDDHAAFRASARTLLEAEGLNVVAEAQTGEDALTTLSRPPATSSCWTCTSVLASTGSRSRGASPTGVEQAPAIVLVSNRELNELGVDRHHRVRGARVRPKDSLSREAIDSLCN